MPERKNRKTILSTTLPRLLLGPGLLLVVSSWGPDVQAQPDEVVLQVRSTSGAKLRTLISGDPQRAKANLLLLAGGNGVLKISGKGQVKSKVNNFLVRSRSLFVKSGFLTALVDAPMDRRTKTGISGGFRISKEHGQDLQKVIDRLRGTNPASANRPPINDAPIVIVGTSRGTVSAANIALETKTNEVRGLILSASLVAANKSGAGLQNLRLEKLTVPLLFVHNRSDKCRVTPLGKVSRLVKKLERAGVDVQLRIVDSVKKISGNCTGRSPHGFLGIEAQVIAIISTWIRKKVL